MIYIYAFLFSGFICAIGQIILDNTKLTSGHITTIFSVFGSILSFFGIYEFLINKCGGGASVLILNFGHTLYQSGLEGYASYGFIGIFKELLCGSSLVITSTIVISFLLAIIFKPKD